MSVQRFSATIADRELSIEIGRYAARANGSALVQYGETVVLATATAGEIKPGLDFFPLKVDYDEKMYASGKIKGSRFVKREGRASDEAQLTGRLIDRTLRPLFPDGLQRDIQIVLTVLSYDGENDPDTIGLIAAAAALCTSDIPFNGPAAGVRVGIVDGQFVINPTKDQLANSTLDIVVGGSRTNVLMIEAGAKIVSEADVVEAIMQGQSVVEAICALIYDATTAAGKPKMAIPEMVTSTELSTWLATELTTTLTAAVATEPKKDRDAAISALKAKLIEDAKAKFVNLDSEVIAKQIEKEYEHALYVLVRNDILQNGKRIGGRALDEIRDIAIEVGVLPRTHGTGLFQRGETQVLSVTTLAGPGAFQVIDGMEVEEKKHYMHHYNFPPFSVGETGASRFPSRRELGHGALAERAIVPVLPDPATFPYTIRVVSEVLCSNGSSSMASTCGSSLSLMDAGVPVKSHVAGIAMGLIMDEQSGNYKILTDILGDEDHLGDMDFKVTGTEEGVTALQMDIKIAGITKDILVEGLERARIARLQILEKMRAIIPAPRSEMSPHAPRIISLQIDTDQIRTVIGKGGEMINKIIDETGCEIDIEDSGLIHITSVDAEKAQQAVKWISDLTRKLQAGDRFTGKVTRLMEFGAFVEVLPGKEGLVHISKLAPNHVDRVEDVVNVGDTLEVVLTEVDDQGRYNFASASVVDALGGDLSSLTERPARRPGFGGGRGGFGGGRGRFGDRGGDRGPRRPRF